MPRINSTSCLAAVMRLAAYFHPRVPGTAERDRKIEHLRQLTAAQHYGRCADTQASYERNRKALALLRALTNVLTGLALVSGLYLLVSSPAGPQSGTGLVGALAVALHLAIPLLRRAVARTEPVWHIALASDQANAVLKRGASGAWLLNTLRGSGTTLLVQDLRRAQEVDAVVLATPGQGPGRLQCSAP